MTTDAFGIATSPAMTANGKAGLFTVTATAASIPSPATFSLVNLAGTANKLAFVQEPTDTAAGAPMTPAVTVQVKDTFGNPVPAPASASRCKLIRLQRGWTVRSAPGAGYQRERVGDV